ncbi:SNF1-interacting protein [Ascosphaera pollenicola]|nr:SNF1-interacting protein [Ascosphaera pollenicola]
MERVKGWLDETDTTCASAKKEIIAARVQIEESAQAMTRPSRELEDYSISTVAYLGTRGPSFKMERVQEFAPQKQGWLHLRVLYSKPTRTTWVRRWAFLKNGIFGSLVQGSRTGGVEETERVGVLLCSVRPAFNEERRFCFEVKTKNSTIMLQAETQKDLTEWIGAFEAAKRKALESPPHPGGKHHVKDPAFAISQPPAPEFAADSYEALTAHGPMDSERGERQSLAIDRDPTARPSGDMSRRTFALDRESDSAKDHTSRLMQKLDIHRKTNTNPSSQGGIASLISAGQSILPIPMPLGSSDHDANRARTSVYMPGELPPSTFAPTTLVAPPAPTSMSRAAVIVSADSGIALKAADGAGDLPPGMMANLWGSTDWALLNRVERGVRTNQATDNSSKKSSAVQSNDTLIVAPNPSNLRPRSRHRQTMSLTNDLRTFEDVPSEQFEYPSCYPQALKTQDAQFRLLFPGVPKDEPLILVFRASFCPNDNQDFPGRCYVTTKTAYFYSSYLGLVVTTCGSFSTIFEVTGAPGRDCDFLYLHVVPESYSDVPGRITFKIFLEPLKLIQNRLNYLINISAAEEPPSIETMFKTLIAMESETPSKPQPPKLDAWGNTTRPTGIADSSQGTGPPSRGLPAESTPIRMGTYISPTVSLEPHASASKETPFFRLPAHPVEYVPQGNLLLAAERTYEISAKALFHVLFGDRSFVWHRLHHWQGAKDIRQGPWIAQGSNRMRRDFTFNVMTVNAWGRPIRANIIDYQLIDVINDHLCYVITDRQTPWQLPLNRSFQNVSKIVLTHVAKSRCKLAVYTTVEWFWKPYYISGKIEEYAANDLKNSAIHLVDIVTNEVRKLEAQNNQTKKAIAIFGSIGHRKEPIKFPPEGTDYGIQCQPQCRGLVEIVYEAIGALLKTTFLAMFTRIIDIVRFCLKIASAHHILVLLLIGSALFNMMHAYHDSIHWLKERTAANFMNRVGIRPPGVVSKIVFVEDIDAAIAQTAFMDGNEVSNSTCFATFHEANSPESFDFAFYAVSKPDYRTRSASNRLQNTRQRLGAYRHDLLVALRVINAIERESLRASWEDWVRQENQRCRVVKRMLEQHEEKPDDEESNTILARAREKLTGNYESISSWYEDYCVSCQRAFQAIREEEQRSM